MGDATTHSNDVFPYFDTTTPLQPPLIPPASVLPLYDFAGRPSQDPFVAGGLVCSSCHDPHDPSYTISGKFKFLRVGSTNDKTALCGQCHSDRVPHVYTADLVIPSRSNSVSFERLASLQWMPPPDWVYGEGYFVFSMPPSAYRLGAPREFVRAVNATPSPKNLRVTWAGPQSLDLAWDQPSPGSEIVTFDVYRDGVKINIAPVCRTRTGGSHRRRRTCTPSPRWEPAPGRRRRATRRPGARRSARWSGCPATIRRSSRQSTRRSRARASTWLPGPTRKCCPSGPSSGSPSKARTRTAASWPSRHRPAA